MTKNNGHWAIQGRSVSPISVPTESPYATSYVAHDSIFAPDLISSCNVYLLFVYVYFLRGYDGGG